MASITECLKGGPFKWTEEAHKSFNLIKKKTIEALILLLPDFRKSLEYDVMLQMWELELFFPKKGK